MERKGNFEKDRSQLFNYLINYITEYKNKNKNVQRKTTSVRLDPVVYYRFLDACRFFGVVPHCGTNIILESLMQLFIDHFANKPMVVQTTLFYKPEFIKQKVEFNIAQKFELKLVKQDLQQIINLFEQERADPSFRQRRLREILPKALQVYRETFDKELKVLLEKAEKYV